MWEISKESVLEPGKVIEGLFLRMLKMYFKNQSSVFPSSCSSTCQWKISWKLVNPSIKTKPSTQSADQILAFYQVLAGDTWTRFTLLDTIKVGLNSAESNENYYFCKGQIGLCPGWQKQELNHVSGHNTDHLHELKTNSQSTFCFLVQWGRFASVAPCLGTISGREKAEWMTKSARFMLPN